MDPLVSVCIPAYNAEQFISKTLESVLSQDYQNLEIIISDDASTDRTIDQVRKFKHNRMLLIENPKNLGRYANCNKVISASNGKYVLKLDADDLIDPVHVSEQVSMMERDKEITFAHCACRLIDAEGKHIGFERSIKGSFVRSGIDEWPRYIYGPRAVNIVTIRRSAFDEVGGYDERYQYSGDWAMHRALLKLGKVYYNDHVIASYRVHMVGKEGIRLIQTKEHLMHIEDLNREWPEGLNNKDKRLAKARIYLGLSSIYAAAYTEPAEMSEILDVIQYFGDNYRLILYSWIMRAGGAFLIRGYRGMMLFSRQIVKGLLYKDIRD